MFGVFKKENLKKWKFVDDDESIGQNLIFPQPIEDLTKNALREIVRSELSTYKWLNYSKKTLEQNHILEWHNWQFGYFAKAVKEDICIPMFAKEQIFHQELLKVKKDQLKSKVVILLDKYSKVINIDKHRDEIELELLWSSFEVGTILLYLNSLCDKK